MHIDTVTINLKLTNLKQFLVINGQCGLVDTSLNKNTDF